MPESQIEQVIVSATNQALCEKDTLLTTLRDNIAAVISSKSNKDLEDIDKQPEDQQKELMRLATSNSDYEKVGEEIHRLRDQKQKLLLEKANRDELKDRIADMDAFRREQPTALAQYDRQLIRRLIEKVTIYENEYAVEFKSGVTADVEGYGKKQTPPLASQ